MVRFPFPGAVGLPRQGYRPRRSDCRSEVGRAKRRGDRCCRSPEPLPPDHPLWGCAQSGDFAAHERAGGGVSRTGPGRAESESVKDGEGGEIGQCLPSKEGVLSQFLHLFFFEGHFTSAYFMYLRVYIVPFSSPLCSVERRGNALRFVTM